MPSWIFSLRALKWLRDITNTLLLVLHLNVSHLSVCFSGFILSLWVPNMCAVFLLISLWFQWLTSPGVLGTAWQYSLTLNCLFMGKEVFQLLAYFYHMHDLRIVCEGVGVLLTYVWLTCFRLWKWPLPAYQPLHLQDWLWHLPTFSPLCLFEGLWGYFCRQLAAALQGRLLWCSHLHWCHPSLCFTREKGSSIARVSPHRLLWGSFDGLCVGFWTEIQEGKCVFVCEACIMSSWTGCLDIYHVC